MLQVRDSLFGRRRRSAFNAANAVDDNLSDFESTNDRRSSSSSSDDLEGPTLITVDDGKGGIRHIRVSRPLDEQVDSEFAPEAAVVSRSASCSNLSPPTGAASAPGSPSSASGPQHQGLGDLLRRELRGRHIFSLDHLEDEHLQKRIVSKRGVVHVGKTRMKQKRKFIVDFFNTMLDLRWRYVLLIFCMSFFLSWLFFAAIWYAIVYFHRDLEPDHLPDRQEETGWKPCVYAIHNFASCFLFSIETQHTIGYGSRQTTEECPAAIVVMSFQSVVGVIIQACMVGIIFAKMSRPKRRAETLMFSRNAVVVLRDGFLCLCFRVANMRSSHVVECHTRAILVTKKVTEEGEVIPYHQTNLKVGVDMEGTEDTLLFLWPTTIVHRIDEDSPFYNMSARDFFQKRYEVIVVLEGIAEPTGMSIQARSSYLPNEILWGYRFANVLSYRRKDHEYKIDYSSFNSVFKVDTPAYSARHLTEQRALGGFLPSRDRNKVVDEVLTPLRPNHLPLTRVAKLKLHTNHISMPLLPQIRVVEAHYSPSSSRSSSVRGRPPPATAPPATAPPAIAKQVSLR